MKREVAKAIANETRNSYDHMAKEFSDTRATFWEELAFLAEHATPGMRVLDVGCGNGRFYELLRTRKVAYTGLDYSAGLLKEARLLHPDGLFTEGDATQLPFPDRSFDIAFAFAVIHHIPGHELRKQFVREVARILTPGSTLILTAWDLEGTGRWRYLRSYLNSLNPFTTLDAGDIMLTFGKEKRKRYLHAFSQRALRLLLEQNGFTIIDADIMTRPSGQKNLLVIARKK